MFGSLFSWFKTFGLNLSFPLCGRPLEKAGLDHQGPRYESPAFLSPLFRPPGDWIATPPPSGWMALSLHHCLFLGEPTPWINRRKWLPLVFPCGFQPLHTRSFHRTFSMWRIRSIQAPRYHHLKNLGCKWVNFFSQNGSLFQLRHFQWQHLKKRCFVLPLHPLRLSNPSGQPPQPMASL